MTAPHALPPHLPDAFGVSDALNSGITRGRLRRRDLAAPYHGVRVRRGTASDPALAAGEAAEPRPERESWHAPPPSVAPERANSVRADDERMPRTTDEARHAMLARAYAPRLREWQFFCLETAAALWGAPLQRAHPSSQSDHIHVGAYHPLRAPRTRGVIGHELCLDESTVADLDGVPLTSPAETWAMLGDLAEDDLVVVGDYFVRCRRAGFGRPAAAAPLTTIAELESALTARRRRGAARLRRALALVRSDSWSPTETKVRLVLGRGDLPEPALNADVFEGDEFLACVDLSYPRHKVAVEYHGQQHADQYAHDVERIAQLRAAGWIVIEVTWPLLFRHPDELVSRVRSALQQRGWRPDR